MSGLGIDPIKIPLIYDIRMPFLTDSTGGFLVYGILIAVMAKLTEKKGGLKRKEFSCEGCPMSHHCNKSYCAQGGDAAASVNAVKEDSENA
jgi:hypothetical protein